MQGRYASPRKEGWDLRNGYRRLYNTRVHGLIDSKWTARRWMRSKMNVGGRRTCQTRIKQATTGWIILMIPSVMLWYLQSGRQETLWYLAYQSTARTEVHGIIIRISMECIRFTSCTTSWHNFLRQLSTLMCSKVRKMCVSSSKHTHSKFVFV